MANKLTTFIPAGGLGSRLRPHTLETPKPLLLMGSPNRRVIDGSLEISTDISDRIWVSTDYLADQVDGYLEDRPKVHTLRDGQTVGSAGSLIEHYEKFADLDNDGDLLVLPSDHIYEGNFSIKEYLELHRESGADMTLMTVPKKAYGEYLTVENGLATSIDTAPSPWNVSTTGTYLFRNSFIINVLRTMRHNNESGLNIYKDIVCPSIGRIAVADYHVEHEKGYWEDTGTPERFHTSNMRMSGNKNVISHQAELDDNVILKRCVVLGGTALRGNIEIEDAIISTDKDGKLLITSVAS